MQYAVSGRPATAELNSVESAHRLIVADRPRFWIHSFGRHPIEPQGTKLLRLDGYVRFDRAENGAPDRMTDFGRPKLETGICIQGLAELVAA